MRRLAVALVGALLIVAGAAFIGTALLITRAISVPALVVGAVCMAVGGHLASPRGLDALLTEGVATLRTLLTTWRTPPGGA